MKNIDKQISLEEAQAALNSIDTTKINFKIHANLHYGLIFLFH